MSDVNSNINVNIDTSEALNAIKNLQRQISLFHQEMARSGSAANQAAARSLQNTLMSNINATGQFRSQIKTIQSETEHFTEQLERNKMSVGQYFRYAGASTKSFGKLWKNEFQTIEKVAVERVKTLQTQYIKLGRDANGALKAIQVRPLALDMNNFATKAAVAAQKQALLNQLLKQGSTAMLNWGKNTQWAGRQLMVGFTVPLTMAAGTAVKAYMDFEKAAVKFKRVYGDFNTSSAETNKMADSIKRLALEYTKYGVAVSDTMNMAADAAAMGKTGVDLLQQVQQANKLAVLGNVDQQQALETTISLTNTFGIAADKLTGKIDFLNAVENQTSLSIEDMTTAIPKAAPVIKQLGGNVEDLAYFLTAMKEGGINASEGANALKSGIASIINPTKAAQDMLKGYGISLTAIRDAHTGDVAGMMKDLAQQLDSLGSMDRARAIEQTFGKFQFARMSTMFQNMTKDGSQANEVLKLTKMTTEELAILSERELKKIQDSPAYKFQKVLADIQAKLVPIGEQFLKAVTPIVEWAGKFLDNFNQMGEGAKQFAIMATIAIGGIAPVALMGFGLIANGVANLIKMFAGVKAFFNGTRGEAQSLGDATGYMTEKELEAQAVASSLGEAHAKLRQEFTLQASAIQNLVAEYETAIGAQQRLLAGMGSVGTRTPGFSAGGTVGGPGGPKSDNLITKVSPGEEVMSVAQVQEGGRIASLIDKLPASFSTELDKSPGRRKQSIREGISTLDEKGLGEEAVKAVAKVDELGGTALQAAQILRNLKDAAKGGPDAVKKWMSALEESAREVSSASGLIQLQKDKTGAGKAKEGRTNFTHAGSGIEMGLDEAEARGLLVGSGNEKYANEQLAAWRAGGSQGAAPRFAVKSMFGMSNFSEKENVAMANKGSNVEDFNKAYDAAGVEKWNESVKAGGGDIQKLSSDIQAFDAKIKQIIADSGATKVFDTRAQAEAYGPGAIAFEEAAAQARTSASPALQAAIDKAGSTARETRVGASGHAVSGKFNQGEIAGDLEKQFKEEMHQVGVDGADGIIEGARGPEGLDAHSPSRKMWQIGMDGAAGLINGAKEKFKEGFNAGAGEQILAPGAPKSPTGVPGILPPPPTTGSSIPGIPVPPVVSEPTKTGFMAKMKGIASDVGDKALGALADGIGRGAGAVVNKAGTALNNYMQAGFAEDDAKKKLWEERMRLSGQMLEAYDAEYQSTQQRMRQLREIIDGGKSLDAEQSAEYIRLGDLQADRRRALTTEMENNNEDITVSQKRFENAQKIDSVNDKERANAEEDAGVIQQRINNANNNGGSEGSTQSNNPMTYGQWKNDTKGMSRAERKAKWADMSAEDRKSVRAGGYKAVGQGLQKVGMVATMAAGALSMLPGPVGQAAQQATPMIGAFSMLTGFIQGPTSAAFVALAAVIGGIIFSIMKMDEAFKNAAQKQIEISNKIGASAGAIDKLAEAAGSVTGSQYMDKIREARAKGTFAAPGKSTFGENFVQGETGKAMLEAAKQNLADNGGDTRSVISNLTNQLSTAVISGALSKQQAQSIAARIAYQLGDMNIAFKVTAQVQDIVGPDGKSFEENPAKVAANLYAKNNAETAALAKTVNPGNLWTGAKNTEANRNATAVADVAGLAAAGALIGAAVSGPFAPIGAAVGALAGAIGGVIVNMTVLAKDAEKAGKAAGALVANITQGQEMQKQMADQLDAYYTKKLQEAANEGKITEYKRLQVEYDQKKVELANVNAQATADMLASYDKMDSSGKEAVKTGLDNAIATKFKDDVAAQAVLPSLTEQFKSLDEKTALLMKGNLINGADPTQMTKFLAMNTGGTETQQKAAATATDKIAAKGGSALTDAMGAVSGITDQTVRTKFLTTIASDNKAEADDAIRLAQQIQSLGGVMEHSVNTMMKYAIENPEGAAQLKEMRTQLEGTKGQTFEETLKMVYKVFPEMKVDQTADERAQAFRKDYFDKLDEQGRDTYTQTITTVLETMSSITTRDDLMKNDDFAAWVKEQGLDYPHGQSTIWWKNKYAEAMGEKVTTAQIEAKNAKDTGNTTNTTGGGGPTAHWTDDVVKSMRDFVTPSQQLTVGINASVAALKNFKKTGDAAFNGLSNQLRKAGASEGMLQKILSDDAKNVGRFFKNGKLTAEGLKVQARVYQESLGKYVDTQRSLTKTTNDQAIAMRKLAAAGLSYVNASEMVGDAELAQAIAHGANKKQIAAIIKAYQDAKVAAYEYNQTTSEGQAKNSVDLAEAHTAYLQTQIDTYQTGLDQISSQETDINKTYEQRVKALDNVLKINQQIADSKQDQLTLASALSKGDIFAAAQAMAAQKSKDAQKAAEDQKTALTEAKDNQIKGLTATVNGQNMTRDQLEEKIKNINKEILDIKQNEINKQKELLALKEYEAKLDVKKKADAKAAGSSSTGSSGSTTSGSSSGSTSTASIGGVKDNSKNDKIAKTYVNQGLALNTAYKAADDKYNSLTGQIAAKSKKLNSLKSTMYSGDTLSTSINVSQQAALKSQISQLVAQRSGYDMTRVGNKQKAGALVTTVKGKYPAIVKGHNSSWVAQQIGISFLDDGKSPSRKGIMKHPLAQGLDVMPAMIGLKEFVMSAPAVKKYGSDTMAKLNAGMLDLENKERGYSEDSQKSVHPVYNINVDVAKTDASPEEIASAVLRQLTTTNNSAIRGVNG